MHGAGGKIIRCRMDVLEEVYSFYDGFKGEKGVFGFSEEGRPLVYFLAGKGAPVLLAQYAMHAREYVTAYVALEEIKYLSERDIEGSVYVLPLVNPDGVRIALTRDKLWKANAKGVDLNVNFDARWGTGAQNKRTAGASDYIGEYPFSAAESAAPASIRSAIPSRSMSMSRRDVSRCSRDLRSSAESFISPSAADSASRLSFSRRSSSSCALSFPSSYHI